MKPNNILLQRENEFFIPRIKENYNKIQLNLETIFNNLYLKNQDYVLNDLILNNLKITGINDNFELVSEEGGTIDFDNLYILDKIKFIEYMIENYQDILSESMINLNSRNYERLNIIIEYIINCYKQIGNILGTNIPDATIYSESTFSITKEHYLYIVDKEWRRVSFYDKNFAQVIIENINKHINTLQKIVKINLRYN